MKKLVPSIEYKSSLLDYTMGVWEFLANEYYRNSPQSLEAQELLEQAKKFLESHQNQKGSRGFYATELPRVLALLGEPVESVERAFSTISSNKLENAEATIWAHKGRYYEDIGEREQAIWCYKNAQSAPNKRTKADIMAEKGLERLSPHSLTNKAG